MVYALHLAMRALKAIVAVVMVLLAVAIVLPNFFKPRPAYSTSACVANLKRIEEAKQQWAVENKKRLIDIPSDMDIFGEGRPIRVKPSCPANGTYTLGAVNEKATCSIGPPEQHTLDYDRKRFR